MNSITQKVIIELDYPKYICRYVEENATNQRVNHLFSLVRGIKPTSDPFSLSVSNVYSAQNLIMITIFVIDVVKNKVSEQCTHHLTVPPHCISRFQIETKAKG